MDWRNLVSLGLALGPLWPDIEKLMELTKPTIQLVRKTWPDIEPVLKRILADPTIQRLLKEGELGEIADTGLDDVPWLQETLVLFEYLKDGDFTKGKYKQKTFDAVERYQTDKKIHADGWAGPVTTAHLRYDRARRGL